MKKGKLKKILAIGAMGVMALAIPFALTGCDKNDDIKVRVDGDYIQWQVDGSDSWTNLLTIDEVKDLLGESYKGDQGTPGINGKEVEFRKTETYIQWRYVDNSQDEDENWKDLVLLSSLKGESGQNGTNGTDGKTPFIGTNGNWWIGQTDTGVKAEAEPGDSGSDGREVEFRTTETHIQWRYIDESQGVDENWEDLISFEEIRKVPENPDQEAINQAGFELFQSKFNDMKYASSYKIIYDYYGSIQTQYYSRLAVTSDELMDKGDYGTTSSNVFGFVLNCYKSNEVAQLENGIYYNPYTLQIFGEKNGSWSSSHYVNMNLYKNEISNDFEVIDAQVNDQYTTVNYSDLIKDGYDFVSWFEKFSFENINECKFNKNGDCVISFYYDQNGGSNDLFNKNYIYEFNVSNDGYIKTCFVYEKDFLDEKEKGSLYCKISYLKEECNIDLDIFNSVLDYVKVEEYEDSDLSTIFGYKVFDNK